MLAIHVWKTRIHNKVYTYNIYYLKSTFNCMYYIILAILATNVIIAKLSTV